MTNTTTLTKITRKHFIDTLCNFKSIFCGAYYKKFDNIESLALATNNITLDNLSGKKCRCVTEAHSSYICFNDGSRLDFNDLNKKNYYTHINKHGILFLIYEFVIYDDFENTEYKKHLVYIIP